MMFDRLIDAIASIHQDSARYAVHRVNKALVLRNWLIGQSIVEYEQGGKDRAKYGDNLLPSLSRSLKSRGVPGTSRQELGRFRRLYLIYPQIGEEIRPTVSVHSASSQAKAIRPTVSVESEATTSTELLGLSWSHLTELLQIDNHAQRRFYELQCSQGRWSVRELQRQIGTLLYERTGLSVDKAGLLAEVQARAAGHSLAELIRDPYVLEFTGLAEKPRYRENDLEQALLDHLQSFLLELGTGFCLEARQKRITVGTEHDWIDLVFYHRVLHCHLLIDLKVRPFQQGDVGQMNFYLNWWAENATAEGDLPPVGLILCTAKDAVKVAYATAGLDQSLFVSRYRVVLPTPEDLQKLLEADQALLLQSRPAKRAKI